MSNDEDVPQNVTCHVNNCLNSPKGFLAFFKLSCYGMDLKITG